MYVLVCAECGARMTHDVLVSRCPCCGGVLLVEYERVAKLTREDAPGIWRYSVALPVRASPVSMGEGGTPLIRATRLTDADAKLYFKDETRNPTGTFLDRGMSVLVTKLRERGVERVIGGVCGDAGASLAAYCARAGLTCKLYVPRDTDTSKLCQMLLFGAEVEVAGSYQEAVKLAESHYFTSYVFTVRDPWYLEGLKTIAYEIAEQLGWKAPDIVVAPVGDGALITSLWKGFRELRAWGLIDKIPRLVGVQVRGADPIVRRLRGAGIPVTAPGIAREIEITSPLLADLAVRALEETGGTAVSVSPSDILDALRELARREGLLVEPSSAAVVAAVRELNEPLSGKTVVLVLTGSGLRTPRVLEDLMANDLRRRGLARVSPFRIGRTKLAILQLLSRGPTYGYDLRRRLKEEFSVELTLPAVYQHLRELERMGLVSSAVRMAEGRRRRYYFLTERGKRVLESLSYWQ